MIELKLRLKQGLGVSNNILINWHVWIVLEKKTLILRFYVYIEMVYMERILFNEDASEETS